MCRCHRAARLEAGLTQPDLADQAGMPVWLLQTPSEAGEPSKLFEACCHLPGRSAAVVTQCDALTGSAIYWIAKGYHSSAVIGMRSDSPHATVSMSHTRTPLGPATVSFDSPVHTKLIDMSR